MFPGYPRIRIKSQPKALSIGRKKTSELRKDWTFPTLSLAKTLISRLAVVRVCPEKESEWTRHKHPT
jgi:hypothetical protein